MYTRVALNRKKKVSFDFQTIKKVDCKPPSIYLLFDDSLDPHAILSDIW